MTIHIRLATSDDRDELIGLTVLAFEPVFASFKQIMGEKIFAHIYPDWQQTQTDLVVSMLGDEKLRCYVADVDGRAVALVTIQLNHETKVGEIYFLVVHPEYHNEGIGTQLNQFALDFMTEAGMELAEVGTGGDVSHAPARRSYEKAGFVALPLVRYYKDLSSHS